MYINLKLVSSMIFCVLALSNVSYAVTADDAKNTQTAEVSSKDKKDEEKKDTAKKEEQPATEDKASSAENSDEKK